MEQVSKAILIAGGVFIGVLLISLFMYMLTTFREFSTISANQKDSIERNRLNSRFEEFIGNGAIKGNQLYSIYGLASDENSKSSNDYTVSINGTSDSQGLLARRDEMFKYTEAFDDDYSISAIYKNGYITSINYTYGGING